MADEVMKLLRQSLIDAALDARDWDRLKVLTSPDWERHVLDKSQEDPFDFLLQDDHFFEYRMIEKMHDTVIINYRYHDIYDECLYLGEIRIPVHSDEPIDATYRSKKGSRRSKTSPPEWFTELTAKAKRTLEQVRSAQSSSRHLEMSHDD